VWKSIEAGRKLDNLECKDQGFPEVPPSPSFLKSVPNHSDRILVLPTLSGQQPFYPMTGVIGPHPPQLIIPSGSGIDFWLKNAPAVTDVGKQAAEKEARKRKASARDEGAR